jgi:phospholipase C
MAGIDEIEHLVVLMLENRSFDQMLGFLYEGQKGPDGQHFEGLTGNESNPDDLSREIKVYKIQAGLDNTYLMPGADPGEGFQNTNFQLFSTDDPVAGTKPDMKGFVLNFKSAIATDLAKQYKDTLPDTEASQIMGMYTPELLPILSGLAKGYAVCDQWFSSVPSMTMPNRAFALAGTCQGHLDDHPKIFTCPSIFGRLTKKGVSWGVFGYNRDPLTQHDFPDTKNAPEEHFGHFRDFQEKAKDGDLPAFSFLEPAWDATGNSQHPNYDVAKGEQLIHDVYYAVRNGKNWAKTLLVITYDEHGGNYDHVPPPDDATPPGDGTIGEFDNFDFTRFGVRVPAVLVSPWIKQGTILRPPEGKGSIDHTSVLRFIHDRWGTDTLTGRDKAAPSIGGVLNLKEARKDTDDPIKGVPIPVSSSYHPNSSTPSHLDKVQAARVASLPLRTEKGHYAETQPDLSSASAVSNFIRDRHAAWKEHKQRREARRAHQAKKQPTHKPAHQVSQHHTGKGHDK